MRQEAINRQKVEKRMQYYSYLNEEESKDYEVKIKKAIQKDKQVIKIQKKVNLQATERREKMKHSTPSHASAKKHAIRPLSMYAYDNSSFKTERMQQREKIKNIKINNLKMRLQNRIDKSQNMLKTHEQELQEEIRIR